MPDEPFPPAADGENNTPEAPPVRPGPLQGRERMDTGCLFLLMGGFVLIFFIPAFFLLGGSPFIIPVLVLFLIALVTPLINPTEKMADRAKWTGRIVIFLLLAAILAAGTYWYLMRETPLLRE